METQIDSEILQQDASAVARRALQEDGPGDVTSEVVGAAGLTASGVVEYRSGGVVAGKIYADAVLRQSGCGPMEWMAEEGEVVPPDTDIGRVDGDLAKILMAERTLLNIMQRTCGIATAARAFASALEGTDCKVLHTRKTAPGLRTLDAFAVSVGGGSLHRLSLASALLVKDNHWQVLAKRCSSLTNAVELARSRGVEGLYVEVEDLEQVREACEAGATRLLIDNQNPEGFERLADTARGLNPKIEIEATGGVTLETARVYAEHGADFVSVGALTHSVVAADLALEVREGG